MRAWILDNGLLDHTGHHYNNSAGLRDEGFTYFPNWSRGTRNFACRS